MSDQDVAPQVEQWMQQLPRFSVAADRRGRMLQTEIGEFVYREHVEALLRDLAKHRVQEPEGWQPILDLVARWRMEQAGYPTHSEGGRHAAAAVRCCANELTELLPVPTRKDA